MNKFKTFTALMLLLTIGFAGCGKSEAERHRLSTNQIGHGSLYALALDSSITIHLCSISTQMYVYTLLLEDTVITCQKDWQAVHCWHHRYLQRSTV